jgi:preprotein translocase subunit SecA
MAQRDPLVEYQREGFQLFEAMNESIKEESVGYLFNVEVEVEQPAEEQPQGEGASVLLAKGLITPQRPQRLQYSAPTVDEAGGVETHSDGEGGEPARAASRPAQGGNRAARRAKRGKRG